MLTRISRIYLRFINFISTYEIRASVNTPGVGKELMWFSTNTKMMIKVQIMIQSLAQKAVCVSSVRPSIINFRETLLQTPNVLFGINNQILGNPISFQNQQRTERGNQRCNQLKHFADICLIWWFSSSSSFLMDNEWYGGIDNIKNSRGLYSWWQLFARGGRLQINQEEN